MTEPRPAFVRLAVASDLMAARVTVARLASEGIEALVLGDGLGPYRLTVGDLAATEIWVAGDRLAEAREMMLASEIDGIADPESPTQRGVPSATIVLGAATLLALVAYLVLSAVL